MQGTHGEAIFEAVYRILNGPTWVGQALAARLTGMVDDWDHPSLFRLCGSLVAGDGRYATGY